VVAGRHVVFEANPDTVFNLNVKIQVSHCGVETGQRGAGGVLRSNYAVQQVAVDFFTTYRKRNISWCVGVFQALVVLRKGTTDAEFEAGVGGLFCCFRRFENVDAVFVPWPIVLDIGLLSEHRLSKEKEEEGQCEEYGKLFHGMKG
jgi:hypothetical protein